MGTIPHGYLPGDDFPVYDASDTYLDTATVPAGYYGGDQLEFFRSMLHKKRTTRKSAYGKTAAMSLAFTVVCIVLISKLVGWWRTRTRKVRKPGADYPSVPSAADAREAKRRQREEQNAQRKAARASRDAAAQLARREADARSRELRAMRKEETQCRKVWTAVKRRDAATLLASLGRVRCAKRLVAVTRAALVVQRASRVPGVIGLRRAVRKAHQCAFDALDAATRASEAADIAAEAADSHMCAWPLQRCFRAHMFRRGFYVAYLQRFCRVLLAKKRIAAKRRKRAHRRGRNAVVLWQRAWRARRPQARKRAAAALAGELLFAEEKRLQRKKRREQERRARARENEKRRKSDRKGWLEKRAAANKAADSAADALWSTLARSEACAAIVVKGARGPRAEKVNGLYRASRKATRPPLFSSKGAHLFVAKKEGTWAWILGDWSAYEASEARGWATSTTVCVGAPPCGKHDFLVADGRGGFQLQWLHCEVVSSRSIAADDALLVASYASQRAAKAVAAAARHATVCATQNAKMPQVKTARVRQAAAARAFKAAKEADNAIAQACQMAGKARDDLASLRSARKMVAKARDDGATSQAWRDIADEAIDKLDARLHEARKIRDAVKARESESTAQGAANCAVDLIADDIMEALVRAEAARADAALAKDLRDLCQDCGVSQLARYALFREEVRDVETLEVVLEDDGWAELLLDAATRGTLRKAMGLLAAKAEADDAAFFWGDD